MLQSSLVRHSTQFKNAIEFVLNGKRVCLEEGSFNPTESLASWLRSDDTNLKGTKIGCGEGGCGACTVVVSSFDPITNGIRHRSVNSCLMPLAQVHHQTITTVEALGTSQTGIHPIQKAIVEHHGTQCGYCTPGFVMNGYGMLLENPNPKAHEIDENFDGNLCRCTGYRGIIESLREFSTDKKPADQCIKDDSKNLKSTQLVPDVPQDFNGSKEYPVEIKHKGSKFYIPTTIDQLLELKKAYPKAVIVVGSSEVGMDLKWKGPTAPAYISSHRIPELYHISINDGKLVFGANTSLQDIEMFCHKKCHEVKSHEQRILRELHDRLAVFSSTQIRNTACVVGNIVHAGAVTDMSNFLLASDSILTIRDAKTGKERKESMDHFFTAYRTIKLAPTDVITQIEVPLCKENEHFFVFKQAHRREDDICIVSSAMKTRISKENIIENIEIAYSGMGPFPARAEKTEKFLLGKEFNLKNIQEAMGIIEKDFPISDNAPGGHVPYRRELSTSFLFKFFHQTEKERGRPYDESAVHIIPRPPAEFTVATTKITKDGVKVETQCKNSPPYVHHSKHHRAAIQQTTGEAVYTDDMPNQPRGLHAAFVMSTMPRGKIIKADYSKCLSVPGVVDVVTYKDIRGPNSVGDVVKDETVLAENEVVFVGQPIAMIVADSEETAWKASKLANIQYEEIKPVLNIQEAIDAKSYFSIHHSIQDGDPDKAFEELPIVLEGEVSTGHQSHFYLETHAAQAIPGEDGKMTIHASTQNPTFTQSELSRILSIPMNKIDVHVKRLGGAFGSKETRSTMISNAVAVAAQKLQRPVRMVLDRNVDMSIMGGRHPMFAKYKVGATKEGLIKSLKVDIYADCGWSLDLSLAITDRALLHIDSAYKIDNLKADAWMCKTNNMSHTAFRGFGAPQGCLIMESIVERLAEHMNKSPYELRFKNLYQEGQTTHFGTVLENCNVVPTWNYITKRFDYQKYRKEVDEYNRVNKFKKRGLAMTPLKFGIAFTFGSLNQAGSLVHIYKDGTVLVSHAGVEMGQGLHTKMCQVAATALGVPIDLVHIDETSTDKVANTSATAASSGADLNGHAIYNACQQINMRLNKYRTPERTWVEAVRAAWADKVDLSAHGFYAMPNVGFDFVKKTGIPFQYYVYGASASIVEIDCLTGDHQVLRSDIVFDAGDPLNPGIDLGQVEGGFLQGYGWITMEEFVYGDNDTNKWVKPGHVHTNGPGYYKIPGWNDVPIQFNVGLLPHSGNPLGVYSSKAIGEPPLLLANSVGMAILDAIRSSRKDHGVTEGLKYDFPLTSDRIRMLSAPRINK